MNTIQRKKIWKMLEQSFPTKTMDYLLVMLGINNVSTQTERITFNHFKAYNRNRMAFSL